MRQDYLIPGHRVVATLVGRQRAVVRVAFLSLMARCAALYFGRRITSHTTTLRSGAARLRTWAGVGVLVCEA